MEQHDSGLMDVIFVPLGFLEWFAGWIAAAIILIVLIAWPATSIIKALYGRFSKPPKDELLKLFDHPNETKPDDPR